MKRSGRELDAGRRRGRELVLQALYASTQTDTSVSPILEELPGWKLASDEEQIFARMLIDRLQIHSNEIDKITRTVLQHWDPERMARVDDCIIRLATCELLACPDIPAAVSIDEAIELAKKYSTEESGRFVNGILDAISSQALTVQIN